jgi:hypothetical protein
VSRPDLYRNVHMGQRARLFALAVDVGAADATQPDTVAQLAQRCLDMIRELREHADHEDTHIHPLLRGRAPQAADAMDAEHGRLDAAMTTLGDRARLLTQLTTESVLDEQHALYLAINELISTYLAHLHAEETVAMPALWNRYSDVELFAVLTRFRSSRTPAERVDDLRNMLPALPPAARVALVRASLTPGPDEEADRTLAAISAALTPEQRDRLDADLHARQRLPAEEAGLSSAP